MNLIDKVTFQKRTSTHMFFLLIWGFMCSGGGALVKATSAEASFPESRSIQKDDYTVRDVDIDITAKSAYEARAKAMKEAGLKGFQKLLDKLLNPEDRSRLSSDSLSDIEDYIENLEVSKEKISRVRYLASFSISFKPHKIKSLFARHGLKPSVQLTDVAQGDLKSEDFKPALIIPVFVESDRSLLWDERNPWFQTWSSLDLAETSIVVPVGDLQDVRDLSAEAAQAGALDNISRLLERYGLEQGFVAILNVSETAEPVLTLSQYSKDGLLRRADPVSFKQEEKLEITLVQAQNKTGVLLQSLMGSFDTLSRLSDVSAHVAFSSLGEWHFIREKLELLPVTRDIVVHSLKRSGADITLKIIGTVEGFLSLLKGGDVEGEKGTGETLLTLRRAPIKPVGPNVISGSDSLAPLYQGNVNSSVSASSNPATAHHGAVVVEQRYSRSSGAVE